MFADSFVNLEEEPCDKKQPMAPSVSNFEVCIRKIWKNIM
jgi:hypothetical protein